MSCRPLIHKPTPFEVLNSKNSVITSLKGGGFLNDGSTLALRFWVSKTIVRGFIPWFGDPIPGPYILNPKPKPSTLNPKGRLPPQALLRRQPGEGEVALVQHVLLDEAGKVHQKDVAHLLHDLLDVDRQRQPDEEGGRFGGLSKLWSLFGSL